MTADRLGAAGLLGVAAGAWLIALAFAVGPLLRVLGMVRPNFRGDRIPVSFGILMLLWSGPVLIGLAVLAPPMRRELAAFAAVVTGMGVLGFADDRWGDRSRTGLKGHFRAFFIEGVVTTGFVKAAGGLLLGVLVPKMVLQRTWPDALLDGLVIALSANALNLFDLRPGRAGAVFLVLGSALAAVRWTSPGVFPLAFVIIPALVVYERDSRGRAMMGDSGSNLLGGALGLAATLAFPGTTSRFVALGVLAALHILAERVSLTQVIEKNPLLRGVDRLTGVR